MLRDFRVGSQCCRCFSAWIKASSNRVNNVENVFIDPKVQSLLKSLNGLELGERIFAERPIRIQEREHYALMTDTMLSELTKKFEERGKNFLQFVPVKEPRQAEFEVIAKNEEIAGYDTAKFVFTDITYDATNRNRTIVVREPDGTLRTALPEEHDRMNRIFYEKRDCPVEEPPVFSDPHLSNALNNNRHEFILDYACYYFEPDNSRYIDICHTVFDRTVVEDKFNLLYSTRHFGPLVFYLTLNNNIDGLRNFLERIKQKKGDSCANIIEQLEELEVTIKQLTTE